ncbi:TetR/AcrR family transcriptional regulator [Mycobacterium sp. NBC_00419]
MALIRSAQTLIAAGRLNVPVLEITQAADVGMGSFYNHFDSKEQLFEAAIVDVLDRHGAVLDALTADIEDPAAVFACSFRLTGRFFRERPQESRILLANWGALLSSDRGLAPRAMRDIKAAVAAGRFDVEDPELTLSVAAGALLGLGYLLEAQPDRDAGATADSVTESVLRLFGMSADAAHEVCVMPLPDMDFQP